jgi:hypothetical protein
MLRYAQHDTRSVEYGDAGGPCHPAHGVILRTVSSCARCHPARSEGYPASERWRSFAALRMTRRAAETVAHLSRFGVRGWAPRQVVV